ncbi:LysR family transcriptional regulator [Erwinia amylovora]|uniref:HTH-type transcriptional regulator alsR n=4 Tax=Erwinia amylovora TaxID=552 RepID=A0A831ERY3_ERWAM|nr:LysR family transcriptional regulator [Erwinia amylovora]CBX78834.1 HTH-type transcriptional regulator alsR [Erwinia amylovora ATCC BAA-2158]CDK13638.1 HTH-type transcriptional regulator alsR [Erwinia amylovora LA635]CDK17005.1 HTH-type transcriptional regulator alsR [Erwinia amylovora LA636]CDK20374.1 HTH-type transcriptional regulator alsR [Erwinia amylovora LA637]ATZ09990.1 transcriptional regulator [Erwinia amylovora]
MELRYLRYFVAVAETRHFTRAAEMLGISQPPLSQQIKKLEEEIGTPLLKRLTRGVELTDAGEAFYQDARQILELTGHALEKAKGIARGISGQLSIGFASSIAFHPQIFRLLHRFQHRFPAIKLLPREENMAALMHDLQEGLLDAAFVRLPCESSKAFNLKVIASEKMALVLPADHRLCATPCLSLAQLQDDPLIMFPRKVAPSLYEVIISACLRAGFQPERFQQSPQISSAISMVAAGFGISIVPDSLRSIKLPGVSFHQIEDAALGSDIALAWRRWDRSPAVHHLVTNLTEA